MVKNCPTGLLTGSHNVAAKDRQCAAASEQQTDLPYRPHLTQYSWTMGHGNETFVRLRVVDAAAILT